jgi:peptidoglycan/LPS O-acetylase OafA/YrhL
VVFAHATFIHTYAGMNHYMVSWSLCVEEHFYLLLPLLVVLARRVSVTSVALGVLLLEGVAIALRVEAFSPKQTIPMITHLRSDGLFLGFLLAMIHVREPHLWSKLGDVARGSGYVGCVAAVAVLCTVPPPVNAWAFVGVPTVGTWAFALIFLSCVHERSSWSRVSFRGLAYLGGLTYAIYLTHNVIPRAWVTAFGEAGSVVGVLWRFFLMLASALALHHLVERPFLRLRERVLAHARWADAPRRAEPS